MHATSLTAAATTPTTSIDYSKFNVPFTQFFKANTAQLAPDDEFKESRMQVIEVHIADLARGILARSNTDRAPSYYTLPEAIRSELVTHLSSKDPIPEAFFQKVMDCYDDSRINRSMVASCLVSHLPIFNYVKFLLKKEEILQKYSILASYLGEEFGETQEGSFHLKISGTPKQAELLQKAFFLRVKEHFHSINSLFLQVQGGAPTVLGIQPQPVPTISLIDTETLISAQRVKAGFPDEFDFLLNQLCKENPALVKEVNDLVATQLVTMPVWRI
jgi:hypothetical protein